MAEILGQLFRLPPNGKPMTIMQLAGFPAEVVDSVVSVLCRMAFDFGLWSDGAAPLLFVCEEAHRYAPADRKHRLRPDPARDVAHRQGRPQIRRLPRPGHAAAGRARPHHHVAVQHAVRDAACRTTATRRCSARRCPTRPPTCSPSLPSLGTREAFAFGDGVALPTRMSFIELPPAMRPNSEARQHPFGRRRQYQPGPDPQRDRPLAQRHCSSARTRVRSVKPDAAVRSSADATGGARRAACAWSNATAPVGCSHRAVAREPREEPPDR